MFPFSTLLRNCDSKRNFQVALPSYASEHHVTARASKMGSRALLLSYASEPCLRAMFRNAVSNILSSALGGSRGVRIHLEETWRHRCIRMPPSPPCHFNDHWPQNTRRENLRKRAGDMSAQEFPKTLRPPWGIEVKKWVRPNKRSVGKTLAGAMPLFRFDFSGQKPSARMKVT